MLDPPTMILDWTKPFTCYYCHDRRHPRNNNRRGQVFKPINTFARLQCSHHIQKWSKKHQYYKCCKQGPRECEGCEKSDHMPRPQDWYLLQHKEIRELSEHGWYPKQAKSTAILDIKEFKDGSNESSFVCVRRNTHCSKKKILSRYNLIIKDIREHKEKNNATRRIVKSSKMLSLRTGRKKKKKKKKKNRYNRTERQPRTTETVTIIEDVENGSGSGSITENNNDELEIHLSNSEIVHM